ncbi:MAG TPA: NAD(P)-dependent oxidoreductase [Chloroflexota bacterium]|jgi:nucleoside-diphosphate-sugar epimerase|nr:NAD(P)-dependent oxidoreductase [Chloroflexota bacterium]
MKVALTGGHSLLGTALERALAPAYELAVAGEGDLRDEAFAREVVDGAQALIHLAPLSPGLPAQASEREVLDLATRGTYVLLQAARAAGVRRVVLGSTLALMERYPPSWAVAESWQPIPDVTDVAQLAAFLAEASVKEFVRGEPMTAICLRFAEIVDDDAVAGRSYDPRWLHVDDAVQAVRRALEVTPPSRSSGAAGEPRSGWWVFHVPGGGKYTRVPLAGAGGERGLGYAPTQAFEQSPGAAEPPPAPAAAERDGDLSLLAPRVRVPSRPIRNVVVFGAGGPLASATARVLAASYRLRLTDLRPLAEIAAEGKPQSPGAPLPQVFGPPHETRQVDVTDLEQVMRACEGMDAIVNCTVVRPHPVAAFLVNFLGAYNVMRAAVAHQIRRVVHTGPQLVAMDGPTGYWWDFDVPDDAPPRPGSGLYGHTKYLGQETVRLFAETYDLQVPVLLYSIFVNPETASPQAGGVFPMTVSWEDAARAMHRALETPDLPSPFEIFHILTDLPHGKYSNLKARRILGWQPRDSLAHLWARRAPPRQARQAT